jgi:hypothetical protein
MGKIELSRTAENCLFNKIITLSIFFVIQNNILFRTTTDYFVCILFTLLYYDVQILIINVSYISYLNSQQSFKYRRNVFIRFLVKTINRSAMLTLLFFIVKNF